MEPWTKELCLKFMEKAYLQVKVEKFKLKQDFKDLTILSSPSYVQQFDSQNVDPFILASSDKYHSMVCLQHDPSKVMNRLRHFIRTSIDLSPEKLTPKEHFEFEDPIIQNMMEIRANLDIATYLKQSPKETNEFIENIYSNILCQNHVNFPFVTTSLIYSVLKNELTSLIDMPDSLLAINVANTLSLSELKEIHQIVESQCLEADNKENQINLTSSEILCINFPEIFQKPKDQFVIALLQKMVVENDLLVVLSAPTFYAVKKRWKEKILFEGINKVIPRKDDSDEILVEKHAILDSLFGTRMWADKYLYNRFPYIDKKENIEKERKQKLQGLFHANYLKYSQKLEEIRVRNESRR